MHDRGRVKVLQSLSHAILQVQGPRLARPTLIAIDGVGGAGKTTLQRELVPYLERSGRQILCGSIDGFHRPRRDRLRRGAFSSEGYYHDSFNYRLLKSKLLEPLRAWRRGTEVVTSVYDHRTESAVMSAPSVVERDAILLFEGVFLLRPDLRDFWDFSIYVDVSFETSMRRGVERDGSWMGAQTREKYEKRYVPGQQLYHAEAHPREYADRVLVNEDVHAPILRQNSP